MGATARAVLANALIRLPSPPPASQGEGHVSFTSLNCRMAHWFFLHGECCARAHAVAAAPAAAPYLTPRPSPLPAPSTHTPTHLMQTC